MVIRVMLWEREISDSGLGFKKGFKAQPTVSWLNVRDLASRVSIKFSFSINFNQIIIRDCSESVAY